MQAIVTAIDPSAGRVDYQSLPDQALMELLVQDLKHLKNPFIAESGDFKDIKDWMGVTCDADGHVIRLYFFYRTTFKHATINLDFLPPRLVRVSFSSCWFHGTLDTRKLPAHLEDFCAPRNQLKGTVDFTTLPSTLTHLNIGENRFVGDISLEALPPALYELSIGTNRFTGKVKVDDLPASLELLDVSYNDQLRGDLFEAKPNGNLYVRCNSNNFTGSLVMGNLAAKAYQLQQRSHLNVSFNDLSGSLDLSGLPRTLRAFHAKKNTFEGEIHLEHLPASLRRLDLGDNKLAGTLRFDDLSEAITSINLEKNKFFGDLRLESLPNGFVHLDLYGNSFRGSLVISHLPRSMDAIMLGGNQFSGKFEFLDRGEAGLTLDASGSAFDQEAVVSSRANTAQFNLQDSGIVSIIDEMGRKHAWERHMLRLDAKDT